MLVDQQEVIFVPGYGLRLNNYPKLCKAFADGGIYPEEISPSWGQDGGSFSVFAEQVIDKIEKTYSSEKKSILLMHSMAFNFILPWLAGTRGKSPHFDHITISSPSFGFIEFIDDKEVLLVAEEMFSSAEIEDLKKLSIKELVPKVQADRVSVLVGSEEITKWPFMGAIATMVHESLSATKVAKKQLTVLPDAGHFIEDYPSYINCVVSSALGHSDINS